MRFARGLSLLVAGLVGLGVGSSAARAQETTGKPAAATNAKARD